MPQGTRLTLVQRPVTWCRMGAFAPYLDIFTAMCRTLPLAPRLRPPATATCAQHGLNELQAAYYAVLCKTVPCNIHLTSRNLIIEPCGYGAEWVDDEIVRD